MSELATLSAAVAGRGLSLRAGPLTLDYEAGGLRYIKLGDREVIRRIYAAVRDRNWGTVPVRIEPVRLEVRADSFDLAYEALAEQDEISFAWRGTISGTTGGEIRFGFAGEARSSFLRNRIGFCVLHPPRECRSAPCRLHRADGRIIETAFPGFVAPQNPFQELTGIAHAVTPRLWCRLDFSGDLFETEDQRNWLDASYKTFCTPLRLSRPVRVEKGDRVQQTVRLTLEGEVTPSASCPARSTGIRLEPRAKAPTVLPAIGLGQASHGRPLQPPELARLRELRPGHLRVEFHPARPGSVEGFRLAAADAAALGVPLEVALFFSAAVEADLQLVVQTMEAVRPPVVRWLVFNEHEFSVTGLSSVERARARLARFAPGAAFGSGTDYWFTQLNQQRPPDRGLDCVCFSLNPQVHAFDDASLVETLETHADLVASAQEFIGATPLVVSPVTLKMRRNPAATGPERDPAPGELPPQVDPRQVSLFGAGWTLGSIKYLAESGVAGVTYYETTGWLGVMETAAGPPQPELFPSRAGTVFPLYHVLADLNAWAGARVLPCASSDPLKAEALVLEKDGLRRTFVANLTATLQTVLLPAPLAGGSRARLQRLNAANLTAAMTSPESYRRTAGVAIAAGEGEFRLELGPFEIARVDAEAAFAA